MNRIRYAFRSALFWVLFVGIVAAVVLGAWWSLMLAPEFGQEEIHMASAPEALEDACTAMDDWWSSTMEVRTYYDDGVVENRWVMEVDGESGARVRHYVTEDDGTEALVLDHVVLSATTTPVPTEANESGAGARSIEDQNSDDVIDLVSIYTKTDSSDWVQTHTLYTYDDYLGFDIGPEGDFCGFEAHEIAGVQERGTATVNGHSTRHFSGTTETDGLTSHGDLDWNFWVTHDGNPVRYTKRDTANDYTSEVTFSNWNTSHSISVDVTPDLRTITYAGTPPATIVSKPTLIPDGTLTPTHTPTPTPTPAPTATPAATTTPTATPEATATPSPTPSPGTRDAWLEPDPSGIAFDGQWREFTIRAVGMNDLDFAINVINYPDGPSSTGAIERTIRRNPPPAVEACETTYYTGYTVRADTAFNLVGCEAGTVSIEIKDRENGHALLRRYSVTVSGGPWFLPCFRPTGRVTPLIQGSARASTPLPARGCLRAWSLIPFLRTKRGFTALTCSKTCTSTTWH